jgi:YHS domain-containing protein
VLLLSGLAHAKVLVNQDASGVAVKGYDPVAFFSEGKPVKGSASIHSVHEGATYNFATEANKKKFDANPDKYAPQFGGYCATGSSMGMLEDIEVDKFIIHKGRLMMQRNDKAKMMFQKNSDKTLARADENWPNLVEESGK